jgi:26S proteasome regulatory subunit N8
MDTETVVIPPKSTTNEVIDVTVHPLVLLSAADHYHRVARGTRKRVVGILLGQVFKGRVDATNSFAVPFEEDSKNPAVFYLDHNYLENMLAMFRKVNAKERVVGFYSTGPQIRPNDLRIYDIVKRFVGTSLIPPVFCIIDVRPDRPSIPTTAYQVVEQVSSSNTTSSQDQVQLTFAHVPSLIGAMEAEEVGVEHLLRDINDPTVSTVASLIKAKMAGLDTLTEKLVECKDYLDSCIAGDKTVNQDILANMQTIFNLLPNLNTDELVKSMLIKTNDMQMAIYLASLIRTVIALHDLVNNKILYGEEDGIPTEKKIVQEEKKQETTEPTNKEDTTKKE